MKKLFGVCLLTSASMIIFLGVTIPVGLITGMWWFGPSVFAAAAILATMIYYGVKMLTN